MSRPTASRRLVLRFLAATFGTVLLAYLIWRIGPSTLAQDVSRLGWGLALVIALGGVAHVVKAWAWRFTLSGEEHKVSFSRLLQLRLVSEAVGQLGVLGQAFGEGLRASALNAEIPAACRISSVTLDRGLFIATGALVMLTGIVAAPLALSLSHALQRYVVLLRLYAGRFAAADGSGRAETVANFVWSGTNCGKAALLREMVGKQRVNH